MGRNKKSPITGKPLRYAGQSLDEKIDKLINDDAALYAICMVGSVALAVQEWWRYYINQPPSPQAFTLLAALASAFCIYKLINIRRQVRHLRQGRDGERAVGQFLEVLREKGHRIFHDLLADNFNLDHVIVSQKGIYVIETKTYSKPIHGKPLIKFNGDKLEIADAGTHDKPISQVKGAAKWLGDVLHETTGKKFPIKPVILFPGWFVENTKKCHESEIWVLNPKALPVFIEHQPDTISQEDKMLISYHVARYIRTTPMSAD